MGVLDRLIGQKVLSTEVDEGMVGLTLTDAIFVAYNPMQGASKEVEGASITSVRFHEKERLSLGFSNGRSLDVSLATADYTGPEAFSIRFSDGTIVVEQ